MTKKYMLGFSIVLTLIAIITAIFCISIKAVSAHALSYDDYNVNQLTNTLFTENSRGKSSYTGNVLCLDDWELWYGTLYVGYEGYVKHVTNNTWQGLRQFLSVEEYSGKTLTCSAYVRSENNNSPISLALKGYNSSNNLITLGETYISSTENIRISITAEIPGNMTTLYFLISASLIGTYYYSKPMVEIGSALSPYQPNLAEIYKYGYDTGNDEGYSDGYTDGYDYGYYEGEETGYTDGYNEGYEYGMVEGSDLGYMEGFEDGETDGYIDGYQYSYKDITGHFIDMFSGVPDSFMSFDNLKGGYYFDVDNPSDVRQRPERNLVALVYYGDSNGQLNESWTNAYELLKGHDYWTINFRNKCLTIGTVNTFLGTAVGTIYIGEIEWKYGTLHIEITPNSWVFCSTYNSSNLETVKSSMQTLAENEIISIRGYKSYGQIFDIGYSSGEEGLRSWNAFIPSAVGAFASMFLILLDIDVFGTNLLTLVGSVGAFVLFILIIKRLVGR